MELSIRYREKGDIESAYKLITANLRLVVKIAMDFSALLMQNLMDHIQEGMSYSSGPSRSSIPTGI